MLGVMPIGSKRGHNAENILSTPVERGPLFQTKTENVIVLLPLLGYYYIDALLLLGQYIDLLNLQGGERHIQNLNTATET